MKIFKKITIFSLIIINVILFIEIVPTYASSESSQNNVFIGRPLNGGDLEELTTTTEFEVVDGEYVLKANSNASNNQVDDDEPLLTVLVHGFGSNAAAWSNNVEFLSEEDIEYMQTPNNNAFDRFGLTYDPNSIIERIRQMTGANIYYADGDSTNSFTLYQVPDLSNNYALVKSKYESGSVIDNRVGETGSDAHSISYAKQQYIITQINDITKHSVVVVDLHNFDRDNQSAYEELNYIIDKIVYDIKYLNSNLLPKINLITHSRGGITALQYALDHPDLVDSVFSSGSPFLGSKIGQSEMLTGLAFDLEDEKNKPNYTYQNTAVYGVANPKNYTEYKDRWNSGYEDYYSHINYNAIGSFSSLEFVLEMFLKDKYLDDNLNWIFNILNSTRIVQDKVIILADYLSNIISTTELGRAVDILLNMITNEIDDGSYTNRLVIRDDLFIDLDSQLGIGFEGFNRIERCFEIGNANLTKLAEPNVSIPHNLEPRDEIIINYILSNIQMNGKDNAPFEIRIIDETSVAINSCIDIPNSNEFTVPSMIDGRNVVEIGEYAFSNLAKNINIKIINIPSTVRIIKDSAFADCKYIERVNFLDNSNVESIGKGAFNGCSKLNNLVLPDSLLSIGEACFSNCRMLKNITLGKNLAYIGNLAFAKLKLNQINLDSENSHFVLDKKTLYDWHKTEIIYSYYDCYDLMPNDPNYYNYELNIDLSVTKIADYAFYGNSRINSVKFNNVVEIGKSAFESSSIITINNDFKVSKVYLNAFKNTIFYEDNEEVKAGDVLLKFNSDDVSTYHIPSNIKSIAPGAFNSSSLETLYIGNNVNVISEMAFVGCPNLEEVYLLDETPIILSSNSFDKTNLTIYIPYVSEYLYHQSPFFYSYLDNLNFKEVNVNLYQDDFIIRTLNLKYGSVLENLPVINDVGYTFRGWETLNGDKVYNNNQLFDYYGENLNLYASISANEYVIYLNNDNNYLESEDVIYDTKIQLPIPNKAYHTFVGWHNGPSIDFVKYTDELGNLINDWTNDFDVVLYAIFTPNEYSVSYNIDNETENDNPNSYHYGDYIKLNTPKKFGYVFNGWYSGDVMVNHITSDMNGDINLTPTWIATVITLNSIVNEYTVSNAVEIIDLRSIASLNAEMEFVIPSYVLQVTFKGTIQQNFNAYIVVEERNDDLTINFSNINFTAPLGKHCIDGGPSSYTLKINCQGDNSLTGGDGLVDDNDNGLNGYYGVIAYSLIISNGQITINGGCGRNGVSGIDGINGGDASVIEHNDLMNYNFAENGNNGQNGSNGGSGGYAVYVFSDFIINASSVTLIGGSGGSGGSGGNGGNGGNAILDGSLLNNIENLKVAGNGGNGGNGGNAGIGQNAINVYVTDVSIENGIDGVPGVGGIAGVGGIGGIGQPNGITGENGVSGIIVIDEMINYYYALLNCETNMLKSITLSVNQELYIKIIVECYGVYNFNTLSNYDTDILMYDVNYDLIEDASVSDNNNFDNDVDKVMFVELLAGTYYLKVSNLSNVLLNVDVSMKYQSGISEWISPNQEVDLMEHLHNGVKEYMFTSSTPGMYQVELENLSEYDVLYPEGTIAIYIGDELINKVDISSIVSLASSNQSSSKLCFFASYMTSYKVVITFNQYYVEHLIFRIISLEEIDCMIDDGYENDEELSYGDNFKMWNVIGTGSYKITLDYTGNNLEDIRFCAFRMLDNSLELLGTFVFNSNNGNSFGEIVLNLEKDDLIYFGYFSGNGNGMINLKIERYVSETFELMLDPNEGYVVGSEVRLVNGKYGGNVIHQGYTRICYLGDSAPDITTRLNYIWISSNPSIAKVSEYGTITAVSPGYVKILSIYKEDHTVIGMIEINVVPAPDTGEVILMYGMDVRVGGVESGTEVTSGSGEKIEVGISPSVTIKSGKTRLICLGDDSPTTSIQDFNWSTSDSSVAVVSTYGTITGINKGVVTICGTYKYNTNYIVIINLLVE